MKMLLYSLAVAVLFSCQETSEKSKSLSVKKTKTIEVQANKIIQVKGYRNRHCLPLEKEIIPKFQVLISFLKDKDIFGTNIPLLYLEKSSIVLYIILLFFL